MTSPPPGDNRVEGYALSPPREVEESLNVHYTAWRDNVRIAQEKRDAHKRLANEGETADVRGKHGAHALREHQHWSNALGALDALERLADELGVALADDRRPHLPESLR